MEYCANQIRDKIRMYEKTGKEIATNFLTPKEVQEVLSILKNYEYTLNGGFEGAERRIIVVGNSSADLNDYLAVIRIKSFNKDLQHRSVLGSVLGLGIKREMVGDIIVQGLICDVVVIKEMKNFLINTLRKIGSESVEVSEIDLQNILKIDENKELKSFSIASLRVDAIISSVFGISREKSAGLINQEKVLINFAPCLNNSKAIKAGDLISVRGFGRIKLAEVVRRNTKRQSASKG